MNTLRSKERFGERGSGVFSAIFGVTVVLVLLTFTAHVLLNLWAMSVVDSVAFDAATEVATADRGRAGPALEARVIERARESLGRYGRTVQMEFEPDASGRSVILHVQAPPLNLLPRAASSVVGLGGIDRRIVVERES